ncbi:hypothetical protein GOP47_0029534 [Adiantum capillus-veneris]|nr:hypothetical protein GOP47_0029534 [Adiantum capillus-veneris]
MGFFIWALLSLINFSTEQAHSAALSFAFDSFSTRNLTLLGDCFIRNSNLGLTRDTSVPSASVGRALYKELVQFYDSTTNRSASFQTSFAFSVTNQNPSLAGDGLAFIIVPDDTSIGSPGRWLGLVNATNLTGDSRPPFVAVEFDTYLDVGFFDINENHVGIDLGSLLSIATADVGVLQMDLKSGDIISAWIDYNGTSEVFEVRLSYTGQRPEEPFLSANFGMAEYAQEYMYVGFSASTEGSQDLHTLYTWSFSTNGIDNEAQPVESPSPAPLASITHVFAHTPSPLHDLNNTISHPSHCKSPFCMRFPAFLGLCVGSAILLAFIILAVMGYTFKVWKFMKQHKRNPLYSDSLVSAPRKFSYKELSIATKGFSKSRVIGHGAFGSVYKGILPNSDVIVAVKRSMTSDKESKSEFLAELSIIACLRHRNLVQLLGWCYEKEEILLVYDYMEQGSLDKVLFNVSGPVLPWAHRYKIVTGVAAALAYLHEECEQQVLHRDVKASNIMVDAGFNARLGDFGLAKVTDHNKSPDATLAAGTMGYLAPEYIHTGKASEKTDVFSYGTVVLEVACGRRPLERDLPLKENVLVDWVWGLYRYGKLIEAADKRLNGDFVEEEMERLLKVGLLCSHPDPVARPSIRQVLQILTGEAKMPHVPLFKPTPSFALLSLPVSLQDIISEAGHSARSSSPSESF